MGLAKSRDVKDHSQPRPASFIPSQGPAIGIPSPLGSAMSSQRVAAKKKQDMSTPLLLTALVDAFSILVIFLLVQVSNVPNVFEADAEITLPKAASIDLSADSKGARILNLSILPDGYVLNGTRLNLEGLRARLIEAGKTPQSGENKGTRLVIQADEKNDFDLLAPVLGMTAQAGISTLEFAVQAVEEVR